MARVESALDAADAAEAAGDLDAAQDHATRARLLLEAAQAEAARVVDVEARREIEEELANLLERTRRDERARAAIGAELTRLASARAAREEVLRALGEAAEDEGRRPRRGRVSLEETADLRRGAAALRGRARLVLGAARSLGASEEAIAPAVDALQRSEQASHDPLEALGAADDAHRAALRALGAARAAADGPGPDGAAALAEAARAEGFEVITLPEGTAVVSEAVFRGASTRPDAALTQRLAAIATAHPHGPIQIQAWVRQRGAAGERLSQRRAEALRGALEHAGVPAERLSVGEVDAALVPDEPVDAARLVFAAYTP